MSDKLNYKKNIFLFCKRYILLLADRAEDRVDLPGTLFFGFCRARRSTTSRCSASTTFRRSFSRDLGARTARLNCGGGAAGSTNNAGDGAGGKAGGDAGMALGLALGLALVERGEFSQAGWNGPSISEVRSA